MNDRITYQELVDEILQEYPERQGKEEELRSIFRSIEALKPQEKVDEDFKAHLKKKVILLFKQHTMTQQERGWLATKWRYAFAWAGTMVILFALTTFIQQEAAPDTTNTVSDAVLEEQAGSLISFTTSIEQAGTEEFGQIRIHAGWPGMWGGGGGGDMAMTARSNTETATAPAPAENDGSVSDSDAPADLPDEKMASMPYPEFPIIQYVYTYEGELPEVPSTLSVYQVKNTPQSLTRSRNRFDTDMIDMNAFDELEVQNLSFVEDKTNWFSLSMDFLNWALSMYRNYDYTEERREPTAAEVAYNSGEVIAAADAFIDDYGIDLNQYGEWILIPQSYYYPMPMIADSSMPAPVVSSIEIRYPYILNELPVYEQYGQQYWVNITYDLVKDYVQGMYGVANHTLVASEYPLLTDEEQILEYVRNGGFAAADYGADVEIEQVPVPIGEPEIVYAHIYDYTEGNQPTRYFVPALKFKPQWDQVELSEEMLRMGYGMPGQTEIIIPLIESAYQ